MSELEREPHDSEQDLRMPKSIAEDPVVQRAVNRDIIGEKQVALMADFKALDRQQAELIERSLQLKSLYPESVLTLEELRRCYTDLQAKRRDIGPDHPQFEETVAQNDRIGELIRLGLGENIVHPTALSDSVQKIVALQSEKDQILQQFQTLERRKYGNAASVKEALDANLYPAPGSERN